jgi:tetratricopeptide (TPR) repeat protein
MLMTITTRKTRAPGPLSSTWSAAAVLVTLTLGCAGTQSLESKSRQAEPLPGEEPKASAVLKAPSKSQGPTRLTDDQRAEFDKAVATYQKLRKGGVLRGADCSEAASAFRRLADDNPTLSIARHNEASVYLECGQRAEAMRIEEDLARGNYAPALAQLGYVAWRNGDTGQAESFFTRAISADPQIGSASARINLAQILDEKARRTSGGERTRLLQEAQLQLRSVLALDGNSLQAYATLCSIYYNQNLPDAAILIGRQSIKRAEEIATGKFEDEVVAETVSRDRTGRRGKTPAKRDEKVEDEAKVKTLAVAGTGWTPDMKRHIAVVHNTLGLVSLNKKSYADAIASFKKAVEMNPELYEARLNLAAVSLRFRDYKTAEQNFQAVVSANVPANKYDAVIGYGVALRGNRKFDEAEQQYLAAQKLDPSRPQSYYDLGLLYQEYRGTEKPMLLKAQQFYRDFLGHNPDAKLRKDAEKRIKDIDELFVALEEAAKLQKEAEEIQRKAEEQQKKMEEEMKRQDEAEKKRAAEPPPAAGSPPAGQPPGAQPPAGRQPPAGQPPGGQPPAAPTTPPPSTQTTPPTGSPPAGGKPAAGTPAAPAPAPAAK